MSILSQAAPRSEMKQAEASKVCLRKDKMTQLRSGHVAWYTRGSKISCYSQTNFAQYLTHCSMDMPMRTRAQIETDRKACFAEVTRFGTALGNLTVKHPIVVDITVVRT